MLPGSINMDWKTFLNKPNKLNTQIFYNPISSGEFTCFSTFSIVHGPQSEITSIENSRHWDQDSKAKKHYVFILLAVTAEAWWCLEWSEVKSLSRVRLFATPRTVAYQAPSMGYFPAKNTGVGCHFLLQGIFPTQGSNPGLLHCRQTLYHLSHQGSQMSGILVNKGILKKYTSVKFSKTFWVCPFPFVQSHASALHMVSATVGSFSFQSPDESARPLVTS